MPKITINPISSGYLSTASVNANFQTIEAELNNKVLYRINPASEPNTMDNDLDMSSFHIINLPAAVLPSDVVTKAYVDSFISGTATFAGILQESQIAIAGQTLISISGFVYNLGGNELAVYVNGIRQVDIIETSISSVTVGGPLDAGDSIFIERREIVV